MQEACLGHLYLIPLPLAGHTHMSVLPLYTQQTLQRIDYFLAENARTARRYIQQIGPLKPLSTINFVQLDKHNLTDAAINLFMKPLYEGKDIGLVSEAGCPAIADPGSEVVAYAHNSGICVIPLVGPCSPLLALMASGLNGQQFAFHGYLPIERQARRLAIKKLEYNALQTGQTQIFIETPYRNQSLLEALLATCQPLTRLCIASQLTTPGGWVLTCTIQDWKKRKPNLHKIPSVFLLGS
jgi:16S rRNA (cytidine1402-2'-O)-methyltransferase